MNEKQLLQDLADGKLSPYEAYTELYTKKPNFFNRARFIKMNIVTDDETANKIMRIIFALPIPIFFIRIGLAIAKVFGSKIIKKTKINNRISKATNNEVDVDVETILEEQVFSHKEVFKLLSEFIKYSKGTIVQVDADEAQVDIRVI